LLFVKTYASAFASPILERTDEIGELERNEPVILLEAPRGNGIGQDPDDFDSYINFTYAKVLTRFGVAWINANDLTADR
jgi:hypothetical protein